MKLNANICGHDYWLLLGDDDEDALLPVHLVGVEQCDLPGELVLVDFVLRALGHLVLGYCDQGHILYHSIDQNVDSFHHLYDEERHHYGLTVLDGYHTASGGVFVHPDFTPVDHILLLECAFDCLNSSVFLASEAFCDLGIDSLHYIPANFYSAERE